MNTNALTAIATALTVLVVFLLLMAPALVGLRHERRIDRQLAAAERGEDRSPEGAPAQNSSSRSTVPSTATWYADGRRSKKLVSS
ncbi:MULTISPECIES: hypothetical protein [unclassified Streptomyces]|uniref:hypothetical protein n=1 Tax=unclassified Streptomyces TaxID=2593676 RepID=UPI00382E6394